MKKKDIKQILEQSQNGDDDKQNSRIAKLWLFQLNNKNKATLPESQLNSSKAEVWHRLEARLASRPSANIKLWRQLIAAAAAIILITSGIYLFNNNSSLRDHNTDLVANDVDPGKVGATLTLANGKRITLSKAINGELADESGVSVSKSSNGQLVYMNKKGAELPGGLSAINTLSTAKGETYQVKLPDGTIVWLNAASSLTYAVNLLDHGQRKVSLKGEAYFEVKKDKSHPFVVRTDDQEVQVLGTHFNVNAYADEPASSTTLLEGSIKLVYRGTNRVLKPGQLAQAFGGEIKVSAANVEAITDWKREEFFLDKMDFRMAMRKIARWYNLEVVYSGSVPDNLEAGGWIPRNSKLSDVLKAIEATGQVQFKIDGKKLYVSK